MNNSTQKSISEQVSRILHLTVDRTIFTITLGQNSRPIQSHEIKWKESKMNKINQLGRNYFQFKIKHWEAFTTILINQLVLIISDRLNNTYLRALTDSMLTDVHHTLSTKPQNKSFANNLSLTWSLFLLWLQHFLLIEHLPDPKQRLHWVSYELVLFFAKLVFDGKPYM